MDPTEKYLKLKEQISQGAIFMGTNILDNNFKPSIRTAITLILIFFVNMSSLYTIVSSFPEVIPLLKSLTTLGVVVQSTYKAIFIINSKSSMQRVLNKVDNLYKVNNEEAGLRKRKLISCVNTCLLVSKGLTFLYGSAIFLFVLTPAFMYIVKRELTLPLAISFPYIDEHDLRGYFITIIMHFFFLAYALVGITAFDTCFMTYVYHFVAFTDLFKIDLDVLSEFLKNKVKGIEDDDARGNELFKRVLTSYKEMGE
jgi:hypothetical protein